MGKYQAMDMDYGTGDLESGDARVHGSGLRANSQSCNVIPYQGQPDVNPDYLFSFHRDMANRSPVKVDRLVLQSIQHLRKRKGSNLREIKKYLKDNSDVSVKGLDVDIKRFLKQATDIGTLEKGPGARYTIVKVVEPRRVGPPPSSPNRNTSVRNLSSAFLELPHLSRSTNTLKRAAPLELSTDARPSKRTDLRTTSRKATRSSPAESQHTSFDGRCIVTRSMSAAKLAANVVPPRTVPPPPFP